MALTESIQRQIETLKELTNIKSNHVVSFKQYVLEGEDTFYLEIGYDLKVKSVSSNFVKFLGVRRPDILGKEISDFIGVDETEDTAAKLMEKGFVKKIVELKGRTFLALVFKIDNKESFGEYLIEINQ